MNKFTNQFMIFILVALLAAGYYWSKETSLDLITRGQGRLVAEGQNKLVQSPEGGVISGIFVDVGDVVKNGQIIAMISSTAAEGSLDEIYSKKNSLEAKLARLDAELQGSNRKSLQSKLKKFDGNVQESQLALFLANRSNLSTRLYSIESEKYQIEKSLLTIEKELQGAQDLMALLEDEKTELLPLIEVGALGASEKFRLKRDESRLTAEIQVLEAKLAQTQAGNLKLDAEIQALRSSYERDIFDDRAKSINELAEINARIPLLEEKLKQTEIISPSDGVVNSLPVSEKNSVIGTGDLIAEIVPSTDTLIVEAYIDPKDIAKIEVGQASRISLTAYDAAKYGYITGELMKVSADAVFREEQKSYMYAIEVALLDDLYGSDGETVPLNPGMIAQVDIIRGS